MGRINYNPQQYSQQPHQQQYPQQQRQGNYMPPPPREIHYHEKDMTVGRWIGTILLSCIPVVNLIFVIYWLFGGGNAPSRTSYVRASLLLSIIFAAILFVIILVLDVDITSYYNSYFPIT
jgi:heme/copper-type cytochrome/quinol oxidase subunit 2